MATAASFNPGDMITTDCKGFDPKIKWEFVQVVNPSPGMPLHAEVKRYTHIRAVVPLSSLSSAAPSVVTVEKTVEWLRDNGGAETAEKFIGEFGDKND